MMKTYLAIVHQQTRRDFAVYLPDFPGCVTACKSLDEARAVTEDALGLHAGVMCDEGIALPEPSSLSQLEGWLTSHFNPDESVGGFVCIIECTVSD
jgi:predicted RNase H-like HicB family nuclease